LKFARSFNLDLGNYSFLLSCVSLILSILKFCGLDLKSFRVYPWKKIGLAMFSILKFFGVLVGAGGLIWFGMTIGNFGIMKAQVLYENLPMSLKILPLSGSMSLLISIPVLIVSFPLLGYFLEKSNIRSIRFPKF